MRPSRQVAAGDNSCNLLAEPKLNEGWCLKFLDSVRQLAYKTIRWKMLNQAIMKTHIKNLFIALVLFLTLNSRLSTARAQGSLTPSGPPGPTMKSLDQIEPRTIVNAANTPGDSGDSFIISQPGSYYLTTNLVGVSGESGIEITANNVMLDLNGFTVQGGSVGVNGIYIPNACTNITVRNGTVSGWGYRAAVDSESGSSINQVFERLNVSANTSSGIYMVGAGVVRDCNSQNNGYIGIFCGGGIISGCTADNNVSYGIYVFSSTVSGCLVQNNGNGGIYVAPGTVSGCLVRNNFESGIYVDSPGSEVIGNTCIGNDTANSAGAAGIYIDDARNRIEDNHVTASGFAGIQVAPSFFYTNNIIIKNSVEGTLGGGTGNNYITPNTQIVGPIITNTVSGIITNSNPWANFSF